MPLKSNSWQAEKPVHHQYNVVCLQLVLCKLVLVVIFGKSSEKSKEDSNMEDEEKLHWVEEIRRIQKEENESVERKESFKKELNDCAALLKKCENRRNIIMEQLRCLDKRGLDFVRRRNKIMAKFENPHFKSNNTETSNKVEESKKSTEPEVLRIGNVQNQVHLSLLQRNQKLFVLKTRAMNHQTRSNKKKIQR